MLSANSLKFTFGLQPNFSLVLQYLPPGFQLQSDNKIWDKKTVDLHNSVQVLQRQFYKLTNSVGFYGTDHGVVLKKTSVLSSDTGKKRFFSVSSFVLLVEFACCLDIRDAVFKVYFCGKVCKEKALKCHKENFPDKIIQNLSHTNCQHGHHY